MKHQVKPHVYWGLWNAFRTAVVSRQSESCAGTLIVPTCPWQVGNHPLPPPAPPPALLPTPPHNPHSNKVVAIQSAPEPLHTHPKKIKKAFKPAEIHPLYTQISRNITHPKVLSTAKCRGPRAVSRLAHCALRLLNKQTTSSRKLKAIIS